MTSQKVPKENLKQPSNGFRKSTNLSFIPKQKEEFDAMLSLLVKICVLPSSRTLFEFGNALKQRTIGNIPWSDSAVASLIFVFQILMTSVLDTACDLAVCQEKEKLEEEGKKENFDTRVLIPS